MGLRPRELPEDLPYWSLRRHGERCLTVEVVDQGVVTALGLDNRDLTDEEWEVLTQLAKRLGWTVDL